MSAYKCLLVGDEGTGKTSFLKRLISGEFSTVYSASLGYEVKHLIIGSKESVFQFFLKIWDISGQTSRGDLLKEILSDADSAIILFDVTSRITFNNVAIWYREIVQTCVSTIPVVIVGNKIDMPGRKIKTEAMRRRFSSRVQVRLVSADMDNTQRQKTAFFIQYMFYDISVKTGMNIEKPILWIASKLVQNSPKQVSQNLQPLPENLKLLNKELIQKNKAILEEAAAMDLSSEFSDEDDEENVGKRVEGPTKRQSRPRTRVPFTYTKTHKKKNKKGINTKQSKEEDK